MSLYCYSFFTIDENLDDLLPLHKFISENIDRRDEIQERWQQGQVLAQQLDWDNSFAYEPDVFFIPNPINRKMEYAIIFKQKNDGLTYVISPLALDHLFDPDKFPSRCIVDEE